MQTTRTTLLPVPSTFHGRLITPGNSHTDCKARNSAVIKTSTLFRKDEHLRPGVDQLQRCEPADEEVQIAKAAKRMLIGFAIVVAAFAILAVVVMVNFSRT